MAMERSLLQKAVRRSNTDLTEKVFAAGLSTLAIGYNSTEKAITSVTNAIKYPNQFVGMDKI